MLTLTNDILQRITSITNSRQAERHIKLYQDGGLKTSAGTRFAPEATAKAFLQSNARVRLILGAIRSGKSTASCAEVIRRAVLMPKCADGVRRARVAIVRNTYRQLETTTIQTWKHWYGNLGQVNVRYDSPITYHHVFNDGDGDIDLTVWFMALDTDKDIANLLSLELSYAYFNEVRETSAAVFDSLISRIGTYPAKNMFPNAEYPPDFWYGVFADTNPPDDDHWIYDRFESKRLENYRLFKQPPAILRHPEYRYVPNPAAENVNNLPPRWYMEQALSKEEQWIKVYLLGEYGTSADGKVVFASYNDDTHSTQEIRPVPGAETLIGWDFGTTPAALICQRVDGQLRVIKEFTTEYATIRELAEKIVLPYLYGEFKGCGYISVGDPSGSSRQQTDGKSCLQVLYDLKLPTDPALTNNISPRLDAVTRLFNQMVNGKPAILISRLGCPNLRRGLLGKYVFERLRVIGRDEHKDYPVKNHPYSDIQDCLQYIALRYTISGAPVTPVAAEDFLPQVNSMWG